MSWRDIPSPLVVIVGPTAVGKTEIAIRVAEKLGAEAEIVSADSRLFYKGMDIGTAKPTREEQQRVPHHLIDVAEPDEVWSLALYQRAAKAIIADIHRRGHLPILVGGTGQYVRAVIEGWDVPPQPPDENLRRALEHWVQEIGPEGLHQRLMLLDAKAASGIDPRNVRRTIRALEVILRTGKRFSEQRRRVDVNYSLLLIGLRRPRSELYQRIDARIEQMLAQGFIEEVRSLLQRGYDPNLPPLSAIGYREIIEYLNGKITLEEAIVLMKRRTRNFVRRQATWFRQGDSEIHWLDVNECVIDRIITMINQRDFWKIKNES